MTVSVSYSKENATKYDQIFCLMSKKYKIPKLLLKAVAIRESALLPDAYRMEQKFWEKYCKENPEWMNEDPTIVSASWGLMQLMYVVAVEIGFKKGRPPEDLCDPVINIELGAKKLRLILDTLYKYKTPDKNFMLLPIEICLSRYNGGGWKNPSDEGILRNQKYADKVMRTWGELRKDEEECDADEV